MTDTEVILTQDEPGLGKRGQVIKVSKGHAQNFLIPQNKALPANPLNLKRFEAVRAKEAKKEAEFKANAADISKKISEMSLTIEAQAGEADKLYGAITSHEIQSRLSQAGIALERKEIHLEEPIKKLGAYKVPVKLAAGPAALLKLWVVKKS